MFRVLLLLLLGFLAGRAGAATIYVCTAGKEPVSYQDRPCAASQAMREIVLREAVPPPHTATAADTAKPARRNGAAAGTPTTREAGRTTQRSRAREASPSAGRGAAARRSGARKPVRSAAAATDLSWECRVANGERFYQHSPCPGRVLAQNLLQDPATRGRRLGAAAPTSVSARPLARAEACRHIHAASASSRPGHERDEDVSSYERSLGRDPCR